MTLGSSHEAVLTPRTTAEVRKIRDCRDWRDRARPQQLLDFPYCQICERTSGGLVEAVQVDHIIPLEVGGDPFDPENLQSLCKRCHVVKSAEEARNRKSRLNMSDLRPAG